VDFEVLTALQKKRIATIDSWECLLVGVALSGCGSWWEWPLVGVDLGGVALSGCGFWWEWLLVDADN